MFIEDSLTRADEVLSKMQINTNIGAIIPGNDLFDCKIFETTREAINDADGSFASTSSAYIANDIDRIINMNTLVINSLLATGTAIDKLASSLTEEISRKSGAVDEKNTGIVNPALQKLVNEHLVEQTAAFREEKLFKPDEKISSILEKQLISKTDSAYLLTSLRMLLGRNKEPIAALLRSGKPLAELKTWIVKEIYAGNI